ncbi:MULTISPECIES: SDR family NAD(P)-dependent oxidoreductase [unclassified Sphingobium]|uniref:SDR family NAD(P)-dependent oxidoreductase n=1 Tax=unclassified Sphingobium TaxID=2611147 RepID=UPI000D161EA6|nr:MULTISPECIES: SDR family oxidoreductase [unclassified Sphingobium]MBG6119949.1 NAD(P)-dependent dehydrogenase (short-subunit alcohol dehydrogenase family) [Sphingobium sp. JAI105]PSO11884.1 NAD(P)-dependent oxidoreductase [Sphingobium sp. AEW4]TWC99612.1 NAD(P)-dependent dehydrogenase (short-subunit alcohol dehydrogenase family) [Sphingobium sp. AEW010]TWD18951.1 NAD(P)-dependent dehydrogenase (short-subunit alcohol dehydrogenase family) [Sphingobium sp. AEW013]TWD21822.1 NAD(P)-dependent d
MTDMQGKVALVTGGGSGIGRASALALAASGAAVAIADLDAEAAGSVAAEIIAGGGHALALAGDASLEPDVARMIAEVVEALGGLDYAHNNVGIGSSGPTVIDQSVEDWDRTMNLSLKSAWLGMKYEIPAMLARGGGAIVNTASMAGVRYSPAASPAYSAAKAGVVFLTRYTANAYAAQNIRVNSVSPGLTATPHIQQHFTLEQQADMTRGGQLITRAVLPEEIAEAVLFLLSDRSAMITGTNQEVCGGAR